jgi:hypothetical protein
MRYSVLTILLFFPVLIFSQTLISGGFVYSQLEKNKMDLIVDKYNSLRPWLSDKLETPSKPIGVIGEYGSFYDYFYLGVAWTFKTDYSSSFGIDSQNNNINTSLKLKMNYASGKVGYILHRSEKFIVSPGLSVDMGFFKVMKKSNEDSRAFTNQYRMQMEGYVFGSTLFCNFFIKLPVDKMYIQISPNYQFTYTSKQFDYRKLDQTLNQSVTENFIEQTFDDPSNFGVNFSVCFLLDHFIVKDD